MQNREIESERENMSEERINLFVEQLEKELAKELGREAMKIGELLVLILWLKVLILKKMLWLRI